LRPNFFVKGVVREAGKRDHTDAIDREANAVKAAGGELVLTDEETFSASTLINQFMDVFPAETKTFLEQFRAKHTPEEVIGYLQAMRKLKVLVVGETIIDEYQFCSVMGKSGKEPVLAALHNRTEQYAGGVLAIANHVSLRLVVELPRRNQFVRNLFRAQPECGAAFPACPARQ
jgi:bifunctional ADP-heptose synthase (sugar kinase/adenylyltransferase)